MILSIILVCVTSLLVGYELYGIYSARAKGLTKNIARMITHLSMFVLLIVLLLQMVYFVVRIPQLILIMVLVCVTSLLVGYELYGIYSARAKGLTKNTTRMITHLSMFVLLVILLLQVIYFAIKMSQLSILIK